jgi:protein TonB
MKKILILLCLIASSSMFAQEWGSMNNSTLTMKEIAPIWPGCESGSDSQRDACFQKKLATHIAKNFKYPAAEYKKNVQGRVIVSFIINEQGNPKIKSASGGSKGLQDEAKRNIMAMPKMSKPGMMGGKPRAIQYTVPFTFKTGK